MSVVLNESLCPGCGKFYRAGPAACEKCLREKVQACLEDDHRTAEIQARYDGASWVDSTSKRREP